ncbi:hypothetical protein SKAU_G00009730 [Synaphobranchus kaupii]|uniref:Uncharacterized protein n=1 Tax=Synaphobranchus kaupii TaxID=118154 RepID=A0A9Q1G9S1_SYNKA|nr:hypothetical protein SKAU_G00009730 [Synaphobranchus kaupii]
MTGTRAGVVDWRTGEWKEESADHCETGVWVSGALIFQLVGGSLIRPAGLTRQIKNLTLSGGRLRSPDSRRGAGCSGVPEAQRRDLAVTDML